MPRATVSMLIACAAIAVLSATPTTAADCYAIFGSVTTPDGTGLEGVRIGLSGGMGATVTRPDGSYRVEGVLSGETYAVEATLPGYAFVPAKRVVVVASGDEQVDFEATPLAVTGGGLQGVAPDLGGVAAAKVAPDAYEADNRDALANVIGLDETQTHNIHRPLDEDWVYFDLPIRSQVMITTAIPSGGETTLAAYGPDDPTSLRGFDDFRDETGSSRLPFMAPNVLLPGRYWVRVQENGQDDVVATYTLTVATEEAPPCRVNYPTASGITWDIGSAYTIRWSEFPGATVRIFLVGPVFSVTLISSGTPNDGAFWWRVPWDTEPGVEYRIAVIGEDTSNSAWSNHLFEIRDVPLVTFPSGPGMEFAHGDEVSITWQGFPGPQVHIDLYRWGTFIERLETAHDNTGMCPGTIPMDQPTGSGFKIRVTKWDDDTVTDDSDWSFSIVHDPKVVYPSDPAIVWHRGQTYTIEWYDYAGAQVRIELYKGGALNRVITPATPNDGSYVWAVPDWQAYGSDYKIRVASTSGSGHADQSDNTFRVARAPRVLHPSAPGLEFGRGEDVHITWENFDGESVKIETYRGGVRDGSVTDDTPNDGSYHITVPGDAVLADDYRIKITSLADPGEWDWSNNDFAVVPNARVLYPSAWGLSFDIGDLFNIRWTDFGGVLVRIQLYKGTALNRTLSSGTTNDGSFTWQVPPGQDVGDDFRIRVVSVDDSSVDDFSDSHFSIETAPVVLYPSAPGIVWNHGSTYTVTWRDFPADEVIISLYDGLTHYTNISDGTANDGAFVWRVSDRIPLGDNWRVEVTNTSGHICRDQSDSVFEIALGPTVTRPTLSAEIWHVGDTGIIEWERFSGANVRLQLYKGGVLNRTINASTPNDGRFVWTVPGDLPNGGDYQVRINAVSQPAQWDMSDKDFIITRRPRVTYPSAWGIEWTHDAAVRIRWENFVGARVAIQLYKGGSFERYISWHTDNDGSFWWRVPTDLEGASDYRVRIRATSNTLEDMSNNNFTIVNVPTVEYPSSADVSTRRTMAMPITWRAFSGATVNIHLYKGGVWHSTIAWGATNDGYTVWSVPAAQALGSDYKIMIQSATVATEIDYSDNQFRILDAPS